MTCPHLDLRVYCIESAQITGAAGSSSRNYAVVPFVKFALKNKDASPSPTFHCRSLGMLDSGYVSEVKNRLWWQQPCRLRMAEHPSVIPRGALVGSVR